MKYKVLYIDPPWSYRDPCNAGKRGAVHKYPVLKTKDLLNLDIASLADFDAACFLWATAPMMPEAFQCLKAWGFRYSTIAFVWIKTLDYVTMNLRNLTWYDDVKLCWGMGSSTRQNAEYVLVGYNGKINRKDAGVHQIVISPRMAHSAKPPEVRDRIVRLLGDVPRLELFAREKAPGWDATGLELDGVEIRDFLNFNLARFEFLY